MFATSKFTNRRPPKNIRRTAAVVAGVLAFVTLAWTPAMAEEDEASFAYQKTVLDNGLAVVSLEDHSCPVVAVHLWYHVGSKDENPERQGFAHMFEHMMFRGTDRLGPTGHFDAIRGIGGDCNAYTSFDQTVYVQTLPANQLELALWLEAERMSMLKIDQDSFDTERKVVEEERRLGLNRPYGTLLENALPELFAGHPYRWSTIGSIPHLRAATVPELRDFWTRYYVPNNATLVVVGDVTHARVQELARNFFGWIPRCPDPARITIPWREAYTARNITFKEKNAPAPLVGLIFRGVPLNHSDYYPLAILTRILGGGESSRLYRRLAITDESAMVAFAGALSLEQDGVIACGAVLSPLGGDLEKVEGTMREEIEHIQREPVTPEELLKARNQILKELVTENLNVSSKASALGSAAVLEGDVASVNERLKRYQAVEGTDVQRVAKEYLNLEHALKGTVPTNILGSLGSLLGFKTEIEDAPITGARETSPPPPGRPGIERPTSVAATAPKVTALTFDPTLQYREATLENGLHVTVVENHEVPFVTVQLGFLTGSWSESKPGTASMAMSMLTEGTEKHAEQALKEELETYAISLSGQAGNDSSSVSASCLTAELPRALARLAEVVRQPIFPEKEFQRLRKQMRTGMSVANREPSYIADRELRRRLYGDHPYARTPSGELEDLDRIEREDLRSWWGRNLHPDNATLIFAGDVTLDSALTLARDLLGDWNVDGTAPLPQLPATLKPNSTTIYLVDHGGEQTQIRVGQLSLGRDDPDYFPGAVVSSYFGGAFSSRLNETIRVKKGLTYGARGGFSAERFGGAFRVSTFSKNDSAPDTVREILAEIKRLRAEPPSDIEMSLTKSYVVGSFPADRETPQQVAGEIWEERVMGLPADYAARRLRGIADATTDSCLAMAKRWVDPDQLVIVVVGPAKKLEPLLKPIANTVLVKEG